VKRILVDADACPVKDIVVREAKAAAWPVTMVFDTAHEIHDGYSESIQCDKGTDSVDYAILERTTPGDIVITQDYGLASMVLARGAKALHPSGREYTEDNILGLLTRRAMHKRLRKTRMKGPKARTKEDDVRFEAALRSLICDI
jgi:uncharacterized protein YaiI (UPF0178 family)